VLATIEFEVLDYGATDIELTYLIGDPTETELVDTDLNKINIDELSDGQFVFRSGVSVSLPYIDSWTWVTTDTFTLDLKIKTLEKVSSWSVSFSFDPSILQCNSVTKGPWLDTGGDTQWFVGTINNTGGVVTGYGCSLKGEGLYATGSGVLATINFTVVGAGWSTVQLTEVKAYDRGWPGIHPADECDLLFTVNGLKLEGDVNNNRAVESTDLIFGLAPAYGSKPGDPNWNPNADFNGNGVVESTDLIFGLAPNYGNNY